MIKIGIYGYGNLGRGVELAVIQNDDMELVGIFTGREPSSIATLTNTPVFSSNEASNFADKIDVMIICKGSATELPKDTPALAKLFNVIDSFDTHANIPNHFDNVYAAAKDSGHVALISAGWDPGMFSIMRTYFSAILPSGQSYTFWGRGVSQGHSDAIRKIDGVLDARQYTNPVRSAMDSVRKGDMPNLSTRDKHTRECFVVAKEGADLARIETEIKNMPNYFSDYDTTVTFISEKEMKEKHSALPHGGFVIHSGKTGQENNEVAEFSLKLDSNPEFTASVLVAFARGVVRMKEHGASGCVTVLDFAPADLSPMTREELRNNLL